MTERRHRTLLVLVTAAVAFGTPQGANAQRLDVSITPTVIVFPPSDPDTTPIVMTAPVTVTYRVRQWNGPWQLTVLASGDLNAAGATVDISNVSWVATPAPPFRNGTLSKTVAQIVASGVGSVNPAASASVTFRLGNSWTYSSGTYTQTLVFTLSAP